MSNNKLRKEAERLASRSYLVQIIRDNTDPAEPLYLALNPELDGCMAQGTTVEEAESNLADFRIDYIEHLLQNELPIPEPAVTTVTVTGNPERKSVARMKLSSERGGAVIQDTEEDVELPHPYEKISVDPLKIQP